MRVLVAGATAWHDAEAIRRELVKLPPGTTIVHGDSPGADALAGQVAAQLGFTVEPMAKNQQDYARYRRGAWKGLNERMLASGVVLVLAFHPDIRASRGSKHLIELAHAASIEVQVFAE
jgi:hypothetical protein